MFLAGSGLAAAWGGIPSRFRQCLKINVLEPMVNASVLHPSLCGQQISL